LLIFWDKEVFKLNIKEWHIFMKNEKYFDFQREYDKNEPTGNRALNDFNRRYQEKYIREHPLTNKIYDGMNNFFDTFTKFKKNTYF